jgi:peptidoglycan hydrolase-like protein with peptidoglycan-binding domain
MHGNVFVQRLLAVRPTVQRCGGAAHPGCACADEEARGAPGLAASGLSLQRAIGDGHDLTSPLFAGDPKLEACFDDQDRLRPPDRGPAVSKVQQALLERGFDLGPSGADGVYGPKTAAAVKGFKAEEQLGFAQFGDVGPGTMRRLDEIFAPAPPSDVANESGGDASCPTEEEVEQAVAARPAAASALVGTTTLTAAPVAAPGGHVSIAEAVRRFKAKADVPNLTPNLNVSQKGQFFWSRQVREMIDPELKRMQGVPSATAFATKAMVVVVKIVKDEDVEASLRELAKMAAKSTSPEKPAMLAMLAPPARGPSATEARLWAALNQNERVPDLAGHRSLRTFRMLMKWDFQSCGFHAHMIAQRVLQKGGISPQDPKVPPFSQQVASGGATRDRRPMGLPDRVTGPGATAGVQPGSDLQLGDVINQTGVGAAVAKMQKALDGGRLIHARVLSGIGYGLGGPGPNLKAEPVDVKGGPPEEHSLVIIGFDSSDTFVFHDPDSGVSHTPEPGFGLLFHDFVDDRLSTATAPAGWPVNKDGKHRRGDKRYQIISLSTF